jgi:hypothetical protein
VLLLEHPEVFTAAAGPRTPQDRPWDGSPVVEVDRGGKITWHGPGQLVGYPIVPDGRKLLRLEVRNAETRSSASRSGSRRRAQMGPEYTSSCSPRGEGEGLHTVCQEAGCPNIYECWEDREATFLIGGDQCTRRCDFCQIDTGKPADSTATSRAGSPSRCRR